MQARDFIYWLRGFLEIYNPKTINAEQTKVIKEHLDKCFTEVVPAASLPDIPHIEKPGGPYWPNEPLSSLSVVKTI